LNDKMLLICYGTRPEYLKIKPLLKKMEGQLEFRTLFTGQHTDLIEGNTAPDYVVSICSGKNRLNSIIASTIDCMDFEKEGITSVLVQGDTTSAMSLAISAFNQQIPVIHLEAGLRTYNLHQPYPEEANRQIIGRIASLSLCPTTLSAQRLNDEKSYGVTEVVGNTVLDNLTGLSTTTKNNVLVTLHRRENHTMIAEWFREIEKVSLQHDCEFILPIHPNPNVICHKGILSNVKVVDPMPYQELLQHLADCSFVITDSGGIQEEAAFLRKPCIVCRKKTERSEGLNNFSILCEEPKLLSERIAQSKGLKMKGDCPYGDGKSSGRIVRIIKDFMK